MTDKYLKNMGLPSLEELKVQEDRLSQTLPEPIPVDTKPYYEKVFEAAETPQETDTLVSGLMFL